jgi:hypothetical protein
MLRLKKRSGNRKSVMQAIYWRAFCLWLWLFSVILGSESAFGAEILPYGANWRYFIGIEDASHDPAAWRNQDFNDSLWTAGGAPIGYANPPNSAGEESIVTVLPSAQESPYSSVFIRGQFVAKNPQPDNIFTLNINVDDGCIVWINGSEVGRYNMTDGEPAFDSWALSPIEPTLVSLTVTNSAQGPIVAGTNTIAVQVFNANPGSSDLFFDASIESDLDEIPPVVVSTVPATGNVGELTQIDVTFSENVMGVDAADLLINGAAATGLSIISPREYIFSFSQPLPGNVVISWAAKAGITDLSGNGFSGAGWNYNLQTATPQADVMISEFMASNGSGIKDDDGQRNDWIELLNTSATLANLEGWYLTDEATNLTKWRFPAVTLDSGRYLIVFASGKDHTNILSPLHTNFKLDKDGGYLALVDPKTNVVSAFANYPAQQEDISYGRDAIAATLTGYLLKPSPGSANATSGPGFAGEATISMKGGVYTNSSLLITLSAARGEIHYSTDGSVPSASSSIYSNPIAISSSVTLKARVFDGNLLPGPVAAEAYFLVDSNVAKFTSNLPLMIFSTGGRGIAQDVSPGQLRTFSSVAAIDTQYGRAAIVGKPEFVGLCELEIRGQTSAGFPKQPYNLEFQDEYRHDKNVSPLGLPEGSDWALYNPYSDKPFLQNFLAYELFEKMGHYSVRRRFVEVFIDTNGGKVTYPGDYKGIYMLVEKIKIDKNRVEIDPLSPYVTREPEISGGYMFKKDKDSTGDRNFNTSGGSGFAGQALKMHDPKPREVTTAQVTWLRTYLNQFEKALYSPNWKTATGTNHYSNYIDVDSFVDNHWIVEFAKQIDGYRLSTYFFKPRNGKVHMAPIWDYNLSFGNADYLDGSNPENWYWQLIDSNQHIWLRRLMCGTTDPYGTSGDPDFNQRIIDRWSELRTNVFSSTNVIARVREMSGILTEAANRDFQKWPRLGTYVWPNPWFYSSPTTYPEIIDGMTNWIQGRYDWIDSQFLKTPTFNVAEGQVKNGTSLTIAGSGGGTIYYTLNGQDPRQLGGGISGSAVRYTSPIQITKNAKVFARRYSAGEWSGPIIRGFAVQKPMLAITETMYHPAADPAGMYPNEDFQFVEIRNIGTNVESLAGAKLSGGIDFTFSGGVLVAGQYAVVVKNPTAFQSRYGLAPSIAGVFTNNLSNNGDKVVLTGPLGEAIEEIDFKDGWYPITDGAGFSLVPRHENAAGSELSEAMSWRASATEGGSPGEADPEPLAFPEVVVNEISAHVKAGSAQKIELQNLSPAPADISGWFISDNLQNPKKFKVPNGTVIPSRGFIVFTSDQFGQTSGSNIPFLFKTDGEDAYIFSADSVGNLTGYAHGFTFGAQKEGVSFGRYVDSTGEEKLVAQQSATFGQANSGPWEAPVIISEIMYHPADVFANGAYWNDTDDEFVELINRSGQAVSLYDPANPTATWKIEGGIQFTFPAGTSIPANGVVVLVNFDPATDLAQKSVFQSKYSLPGNGKLFGPYSGNLGNDGDRITLLMPDAPIPSGSNGTQIPYMVEDQVEYSDHGGWNAGADGFGFSLTRKDLAGYGNDPAKWSAALPTPGNAASPAAGPTITTQPKTQFASVGQTVSFNVQASGSGTLKYQWLFKGQPIPSATSSAFALSKAQSTNSGDYSVVVSSATAAVTSDPAFLTVSIDSDGDGMPDSWEFSYGLNAYDPADATADADQDGFSNRDEFIAGTNPRAAGSSLRVAGADSGSQQSAAMQFFAAAGRSYSILYSDSITQPVWKKLMDVAAGSKGSERLVTDPNPGPQRYYRVVTPAQ